MSSGQRDDDPTCMTSVPGELRGGVYPDASRSGAEGGDEQVRGVEILQPGVGTVASQPSRSAMPPVIPTGQPEIQGGGLRWQFYDPYDTDPDTNTYTFRIAPNTMTTPHPQRAVNSMVSTAGQALLFEGSTPTSEWSFGGVLLHRAQYLALQGWVYNRGRRVEVFDHFGRRHTCVLTRFDATPKRSLQHYWRHEWTISAIVIRTTGPQVGDIYGNEEPWYA